MDFRTFKYIMQDKYDMLFSAINRPLFLSVLFLVFKQSRTLVPTQQTVCSNLWKLSIMQFLLRKRYTFQLPLSLKPLARIVTTRIKESLQPLLTKIRGLGSMQNCATKLLDFLTGSCVCDASVQIVAVEIEISQSCQGATLYISSHQTFNRHLLF